MESATYSLRLVLPTSLADEWNDRCAGYAYVARDSQDTAEVETAIKEAVREPVMLCGNHRPIRDQFPVMDLSMFEQRYPDEAHTMQRNQLLRQYGAMLGWELRVAGFSAIRLKLEHKGKRLFATDPERNGDCAAAFWSGLRTEGLALALDLPGEEKADWTQMRYPLISGLPFVVVPHGLATEATFADLMHKERFSGVAYVSGLGKRGLDDQALVSEAVRLLDMGWNAILLDDLEEAAAAQLATTLSEIPVKNNEAQQDSLGRLNKRREMLLAIEDRGSGFVSLDRDPEYPVKRLMFANKLKIEDQYSAQERTSRFGSLVRFHYALYVDGELKEENRDEGLRAMLGRHQVIPGLEKALMGRRKGETFTVEVSPEEAYGVHDPEQVFRLPRKGILLAPGERLQLGGRVTIPQQGDVIYGRIVEMTEDEVVVDANHDLAGKTLTFEVSVIDII